MEAFLATYFPLFNLLFLGVALIKIKKASAEDVARFNIISIIVYHKSKTYACIVTCVSVLVQPQTNRLLKHCLPLFLWPSWYMVSWSADGQQPKQVICSHIVFGLWNYLYLYVFCLSLVLWSFGCFSSTMLCASQ